MLVSKTKPAGDGYNVLDAAGRLRIEAFIHLKSLRPGSRDARLAVLGVIDLITPRRASWILS